MKDLTKLICSLGFVALIGACAPYPPYPGQQGQSQEPSQQAQPEQQVQQTATDEKQRQIEADRRRLKQKEAARRKKLAAENNTVSAPKPAKPNYPTATAVPGKEGFVFNPYTQNIVDIRGVASGKLVRDPEDADLTHKFRVP